MIISPVLNNVLVGGVGGESGSGNTYESIAIDEGFVLIDKPDEIVIEEDDVIVFDECGVD